MYIDQEAMYKNILKDIAWLRGRLQEVLLVK